MSGGVDSTAAALILKGSFAVEGFFMDLAQPDFEEQKNRVEHLAATMGIPLHIIDLKADFKKRVLDYFTGSYFHGRTPNPCMICNREIKFGLFMDAILSAGMTRVATGHYARLDCIENEYFLYTGVDAKKDQSYFLSRLTQQQLSRVMFPLGSMSKDDIYRFVEHNGYSDFRGIESQDICFLKNKRLSAFLENDKEPLLSPAPSSQRTGGNLADTGTISLYHRTAPRSRPSRCITLVCLFSRLPDNVLVVGKNKDLFSSSLIACNAHWINRMIPEEQPQILVRIRYSHPGAAARFTWISKDSFRLSFDEAQRAVAPGQYAVFYDGDKVVGSGEIVSGQ